MSGMVGVKSEATTGGVESDYPNLLGSSAVFSWQLSRCKPLKKRGLGAAASDGLE
jgi:hypothetical protein